MLWIFLVDPKDQIQKVLCYYIYLLWIITYSVSMLNCLEKSRERSAFSTQTTDNAMLWDGQGAGMSNKQIIRPISCHQMF